MYFLSAVEMRIQQLLHKVNNATDAASFLAWQTPNLLCCREYVSEGPDVAEETKQASERKWWQRAEFHRGAARAVRI